MGLGACVDVMSLDNVNKELKSQKRYFNNGLIPKLRKEIKFSWQSKAQGRKCGRKEVLGEKGKKEAGKAYLCRKPSASKNFSKKTTEWRQRALLVIQLVFRLVMKVPRWFWMIEMAKLLGFRLEVRAVIRFLWAKNMSASAMSRQHVEKLCHSFNQADRMSKAAI
ncbi:hypothetical protein TNCV_4198451 [Trichonephila clavipes]|nr:hypothetical protein TNCV_4198451 [Trichonephila clavipes]